jgi:sorting nexin-4
VTTAHETSDAFNDATLREQTIFQYAKEAEMKEVLGDLADGQIEFYKAVRTLQRAILTSVTNTISQAMEEWDRVIPIIQRIRVDV